MCLQEIQKELQNQQMSIDSARESLNTLCRKYPSEELAALGSSLTDLIKKYETVNQLCVKKLSSLQFGLQQHFNGQNHNNNVFYKTHPHYCVTKVISVFRSCQGVSHMAYWTEGNSERMLRSFR